MYWIAAGALLACAALYVVQNCRTHKAPTPMNSICFVAVLHRNAETNKIDIKDVTQQWKTQAGDDDTNISSELVRWLKDITHPAGKCVVVAEDYDLDVRVYMGSTGDMLSSTYVDFDDMLQHVDSLLSL